MDLKEALNIIGLPKTATSDEFKVKYKELAKKYHPDLFKDDPNKFKKINEAYDLIKDYKVNPDKYDKPPPSIHNSGGFRRVDIDGFSVNFDDFFTNAGVQTPEKEKAKTFSYGPLNTPVTISFKESVIGANKEITYKKYVKCTHCNAKGSQSTGNGCQSCNGFGRIISNNKGMVFTKVCTKCYGKDIKVQPCTPCNSVGVSEVDVNVTIHIPPGTINNSTLRLRAGGHYLGGNVFGDAYADVYVFVNVMPEEGLSLEGQHVISHIKLTLLEALTGCNKEVKTIYDTQDIEIPAKSKNKDEIHLHGKGVVSTGGVQRVIFDVEYPSDTDELIKYLKNKEN